MTFRGWLRLQEQRDTPAGHLAREVAGDRTIPAEWHSIDALRSHLVIARASPAVLRTLEDAASQWRHTTRPERRPPPPARRARDQRRSGHREAVRSQTSGWFTALSATVSAPDDGSRVGQGIAMSNEEQKTEAGTATTAVAAETRSSVQATSVEVQGAVSGTRGDIGGAGEVAPDEAAKTEGVKQAEVSETRNVIGEPQDSVAKATEAVTAVASKMRAMAVETEGLAAETGTSRGQHDKVARAEPGAVKKPVRKKAVVKKAKVTAEKRGTRVKRAAATKTVATRNAAGKKGRVAKPAVRRGASRVARKTKAR
jgi:hypothetical protein